MKYFNIAGPCNDKKHYMIEASSRLEGVDQLIDLEQYFVIHAARQSGKTTYLQDLTKRLNARQDLIRFVFYTKAILKFTKMKRLFKGEIYRLTGYGINSTFQVVSCFVTLQVKDLRL